MPGLAGTHSAAAQAMKAAEDAVTATWRALNRVLTLEEIEQMKVEVRAAGIEALFLHLQVNIVVAGTATGAMAGGPGVPVVGTIA